MDMPPSTRSGIGTDEMPVVSTSGAAVPPGSVGSVGSVGSPGPGPGVLPPPSPGVGHEVEIPERLRELPYLQPVYDHPQFLVRNVWRRYGGWYDGEPDNLLPAPRAEQASEWVTLAGGLERVLARARELAAAGDHRLACHLVEFAVLFDPSSTEAHEVRAEVYAERSGQQVSSMARNILGHAAHASRQHKRDLAGDYDY